jgi:hypothetical protein
MNLTRALLEDGQGRNRHHAIGHGGLRVLLDVDLDDLDLVAQFSRDLGQQRVDLFAGHAPLGPEIDEYRLVGPKNVTGERLVGDHLCCSHQDLPVLQLYE